MIPYSIQTLKRRRPDWFREDLRVLLNLLKQEKNKPIIAARMPLNQAVQLISYSKRARSRVK